MAVFDLPLPELSRYKGRNPRPSDFDRYWDEALQELGETAAKPQLLPSTECKTRDAECFDLSFQGVGGARQYAKYLRPKGAKNCPVILLFHGYSGNSGDWFDKLSWVQEGFCVAALDCRGQGGKSEDNHPVNGTTLRGHIIRGLSGDDPRQLAYRRMFLDTVQLARVVMGFPEVDANRLGCYGESQGGALALACAALEPGIRRAVSVFPFLCDYQRVWEMDLAKDAYEELRYYFRSFDPQHLRINETFIRLGYIDCQHLAPRIRAKVLMFTGLMDTVCPPSSQFAAYNKITAEKEMKIYPDFGHERLPGQADQTLEFMHALRS
ncbi:MAG: acetyl esterase [Lacunisphaera sp.]|nr:acetyl esterase [Lacunisphaera sp.]